MRRPGAATLKRLARATAGVTLIAIVGVPALRNLPILQRALVWAPLRWGLWSLGVLAVLGAAWQAWATWAEGESEETHSASETGAQRRNRAIVDVVSVLALATGGIGAHAAWQRIASPERVLSGYDFNTYALNALAVRNGEWDLFNGDKHVFHARVVGWLANGGNLREAAVELAVVCIGLFPAVTYVLARRAGGRFTAWMAAMLAFACPLPWHFSTQTTAYPLFYFLVLAAAAAVLWAVQRPSPWSALAAGLLAGVAASTQEKAPISLAPVLGLACLLAVGPVWRAWGRSRRRTVLRLVALPALGVLTFVGVLRVSAPGKAYTPLVSLVTNQRQEIHIELDYHWPEVKTPDVNDPAGVRTWLPKRLWDGEIESWLAAARTPPDSNSFRLAPEPDGRNNPWKVVPETTIAPLALRLESSLRNLDQVYGPLPFPGLVLVSLGTLSLLFLARPRQRIAVALIGCVVSGLAPLTLKFGIHYFAHLLPLLAVLTVCGLDHLVRALLPGAWAWPGRIVVTSMIGAYALALWTNEADAWRSPALTFPPPAAIPAEDPGGYAQNLLHVGAWLEAQPHPGPILDCAPGSILLALPDDPRISHVLGEQACLSGLAAPMPGTWVVASRHPSYRGPATPDPDRLLASGRWKLIYGWNGARGAVSPEVTRLPMSALVVLEAT
ncbi:hypothetical protein LBMAG42_28880 [Deltaproteobacteria bacterium]|nr:hypothetical protein LBMAG42_28880 [Deltaproteobacteria bacterium]